MGLTRRGHGDSDYPEKGYDPDSLTEDIRQFLDSLNVEKAILVGHSLAGVELTHFSDAYTEEQKAAFYQFNQGVERPFFQSLISEFQSRFPQARIIVIPDGHHYCYMAQEDMIYTEMRKFLV